MSMREVAPVGLDSFSAPRGGAAAELKRLGETTWAEVRAIGRKAVKAECGAANMKVEGAAMQLRASLNCHKPESRLLLFDAALEALRRRHCSAKPLSHAR